MSWFSSDNIQIMQFHPLDDSRFFRLIFQSEYPDCLHQLYGNGELIDVTEFPEQNWFEIPKDQPAMFLNILAIDPVSRHEDFSAAAGLSIPGWIFKADLIRSLRHQPGEKIFFFHDDATGAMLIEPALCLPLWPEDHFHWGFGQDVFGAGGFGFDGTAAQGFGSSSLGAGPFGFGGDVLPIRLPLMQAGEYRIQYVVQNHLGKTSPVTEILFQTEPPPFVPEIFTTPVDDQTIELTLQA